MAAEVYEVCSIWYSWLLHCNFVCTRNVYLRVSMDNATCHWVCVSAVMDTLEWTAVAKVVILHYLSPAEHLRPAGHYSQSPTPSIFTFVCASTCFKLVIGLLR